MAQKPPHFHSHDFNSLGVREIYKFFTSAIVPRPIAFVSTIDEVGVTNLAPFSFFNGVSSNPPCLAVSVARKRDGAKKDTLLNIEKTREFVVNSAEEDISNQVNACSESFPYGTSEIEKVGLTTIASTWVKPPRILESAIQMECRLEKIVELGENTPGATSLIIGRVLGIHIANRVIENGEIRYEKLKPIARLGRDEYLRGGDIFRLPRP
jgi:flavin reductase (DIM6/NTAB) family NADH-FMN oxidoreductase RutF